MWDATERWVDDAQGALNNDPACDATVEEGDVTLYCDRRINHSGLHRQLVGRQEQLWMELGESEASPGG